MGERECLEERGKGKDNCKGKGRMRGFFAPLRMTGFRDGTQYFKQMGLSIRGG